MITIAKAVADIIKQNSYLEDLLAEDLINLSALARKIKPQLAKELWKEDVSLPAIIMALKRLQTTLKKQPARTVDLSTLGDMTVRSNLTLFIYENSSELMTAQKKLLEFVEQSKERFLNVSQGLLETSIIVSTAATQSVKKWLAKQKPIYQADNLACITIAIPHESTFIPGYIYNVLRPLALENINVMDITSVNREITFIFKDEDVDKAFSVLKRARQV